jgi:hypothetical protein
MVGLGLELGLGLGLGLGLVRVRVRVRFRVRVRVRVRVRAGLGLGLGWGFFFHFSPSSARYTTPLADRGNNPYPNSIRTLHTEPCGWVSRSWPSRAHIACKLKQRRACMNMKHTGTSSKSSMERNTKARRSCSPTYSIPRLSCMFGLVLVLYCRVSSCPLWSGLVWSGLF